MQNLERDLRDLGRVKAPSRFGDRVLAMAGLLDAYAEVATPIGPYYVAWSSGGVSAATRADVGEKEFEYWLAAERGRPPVRVSDVPARIRRAFATGRGRGLTYDLRTLTEFERDVLMKTLEIPHGEVRPYAWVAREIGRPRAVRAVGTVLAHNPVPVLIPCHRVVRSDGELGQYSGGGPERKKAILVHEGFDTEVLESLARQGARLRGSRTTRIFCLPGCRGGRRTRPENQVPFRDEREARAAGYRPCLHCRPALAS